MAKFYMRCFFFCFIFIFKMIILAQPNCHARLPPGQLAGRQVAVVVYAQHPEARGYIKTALTRMESILNDNDITALDQAKVEELKDVFKTLDDPSAFVTAEDFAANAEKFKMAALVAVYLHVSVSPGLADYSCAGAYADIRLDCFDVEKKSAGEKGDRKILDCMFVSNWRFLAAASSGKLFFWDTERGILLDAPLITPYVKSIEMGLARNGRETFLVLSSNKGKIAYQIVRASR